MIYIFGDEARYLRARSYVMKKCKQKKYYGKWRVQIIHKVTRPKSNDYYVVGIEKKI